MEHESPESDLARAHEPLAPPTPPSSAETVAVSGRSAARRGFRAWPWWIVVVACVALVAWCVDGVGCGAGADEGRDVGARDGARGFAAGWWAVDRDADSVERLDAALRPLLHVRAPHPVRVAALRDGGAWVLCANQAAPSVAPGDADIDPRARVEHELWRFDAFGRRTELHRVGAALDFTSRDDGTALLLARRADRTLLRWFPPVAAPRDAVVDGDARRLAAIDDRQLLATSAGRLVLLDADGVSTAERDCGGSVVALAGSAPHEWWMLVRVSSEHGVRTHLHRLDAALRSAWSREIELEAPCMDVSDSGDDVWLADERDARVVRVGADGRVGLELVDAPQRGISRALALGDGGALFVVPGAILRVSAHGDWLAGQGGFDALVDLCAAR